MHGPVSGVAGFGTISVKGRERSVIALNTRYGLLPDPILPQGAKMADQVWSEWLKAMKDGKPPFPGVLEVREDEMSNGGRL